MYYSYTLIYTFMYINSYIILKVEFISEIIVRLKKKDENKSKLKSLNNNDSKNNIKPAKILFKIGDTVKWNGKIWEIVNMNNIKAQIQYPINVPKYKRNSELVKLTDLTVCIHINICIVFVYI